MGLSTNGSVRPVKRPMFGGMMPWSVVPPSKFTCVGSVGRPFKERGMLGNAVKGREDDPLPSLLARWVG